MGNCLHGLASDDVKPRKSSKRSNNGVIVPLQDVHVHDDQKVINTITTTRKLTPCLKKGGRVHDDVSSSSSSSSSSPPSCSPKKSVRFASEEEKEVVGIREVVEKRDGHGVRVKLVLTKKEAAQLMCMFNGNATTHVRECFSC